MKGGGAGLEERTRWSSGKEKLKFKLGFKLSLELENLQISLLLVAAKC